MFTGIIKHQGEVIQNKNRALVLRVPPRVAARLKQGDSVAVNGVCLSVLTKEGAIFTFDVMPETLRVTNLGALQAGMVVNIEEPLRWGAPLGGHLVQGHVEGVGKLLSLGDIWNVQLPRALMRYVKAKGSIALEGISLTVVKKLGTTITVSLLEDTLRRTNLRNKAVGDTLNVETDLLLKL